MEENLNSRTPDPENAERIFFWGGVLLVALFIAYHLLSRDEGSEHSLYLPWFDVLGAVAGVLLGILNLRSWKVFVGLVISGKADGSQMDMKSTAQRALLFLFLKGLVVTSLLLLLITSGSNKIVSLLLGFTMFLLVGTLLLAAAHIVGQRRE